MTHRQLTLAADAAPLECFSLLSHVDLMDLCGAAEARALAAHGVLVTYSRKVFIPLTRLCRDVCHYCTFATAPRHLETPFLSVEEAVAIAQAGARRGCREALFTLGDRPEARYAVARDWLARNGFSDTLSYLGHVAEQVFARTGLMPHLNPGLLTATDFAKLRPRSASMGLMLESASARLCERGGPHFGSPDKNPLRRLESIAAAGRARVPFTTGLLIGIGETRLERIEALCAIRDLHLEHGHIQEVIVQNFKAKPGTRMAGHPDPSLEEQLWTIASARLILPAEVSIQAPPNLRSDALAALIGAGVSDWGGVSPVTPDHVNPEAPWPELAALEALTAASGRLLRQRLAIGPRFVVDEEGWLDPNLRPAVLRASDARGLARDDEWFAGGGAPLPTAARQVRSGRVQTVLAKAVAEGTELDEADVVTLFEADGGDLEDVVALADQRRAQLVGDAVTFVVNRNINYTNICLYRCGFCAFSKGGPRKLRGPGYLLDLDEVGQRAREAWDRGASEVCLQGGIHPAFDGDTYLSIVRAVKAAAPSIHVHAFSPLEVMHGATTLGLDLPTYLTRLRDAGLGSLPGTAAEILHDEVRSVLCPDKLSTAEWVAVMRAAHGVGLKSTSTIMFGHVDAPRHWAEHLRVIRTLQRETGGFTEFVPLPFVHMEAPIWRKGRARSGPTWRETRLMHAIARLYFDRDIPNIQASWVKAGEAGVTSLLQAGVNDLGGVLMDESITRAAGGAHGQLFDEERMRAVAGSLGRRAVRRTTLYRTFEPALAGTNERVLA